MRILHIIPNLLKGGAERLVTDTVRELSKRKDVEVGLVTFRGDVEYPTADISSLIRVIPSQVTLSIIKPDQYQIDELQAFVDSFRPDVIHSHLFEAEIVSRSLNYKDAKWITHCHWNTPAISRPKLIPLSKRDIVANYEFGYILKRYIKYNNHFVAVSKDTSDYYKKNLPELKDNVHYIPNAVNTSAFMRSTPRTDIADKKIQLMSVGSLSESKNQSLQIDIAAILKKRGVNFHLDIYGKGTIHDLLQKKILALGLEEHVTLCGVSDDVNVRLADSDLFIHTSLSESFGLVIVEAMAAGLPVVTLDAGGNRELMQNALNGYLIKERDPEIFADKIMECIRPDKYLSLCEGALKTATQYDIVPYVSKLLDLYAQ